MHTPNPLAPTPLHQSQEQRLFNATELFYETTTLQKTAEQKNKNKNVQN
jgi:hypothetical protein